MDYLIQNCTCPGCGPSPCDIRWVNSEPGPILGNLCEFFQYQFTGCFPPGDGLNLIGWPGFDPAPTGISLHANGLISGTPTQTWNSNITLMTYQLSNVSNYAIGNVFVTITDTGSCCDCDVEINNGGEASDDDTYDVTGDFDYSCEVTLNWEVLSSPGTVRFEFYAGASLLHDTGCLTSVVSASTNVTVPAGTTSLRVVVTTPCSGSTGQWAFAIFCPAV